MNIIFSPLLERALAHFIERESVDPEVEGANLMVESFFQNYVFIESLFENYLDSVLCL